MRISDDQIIEMIARYNPDEFDRDMNHRRNGARFGIYLGLFMLFTCSFYAGGWFGVGASIGAVLFVSGIVLRQEVTLIKLRRNDLMRLKGGDAK